MGRIIELQDMAVGTMYGPTSAVDGQLYRADETSGVKMQVCPGIVVDDNGHMTSTGNINAATFDTNIAAAGVTLSGTTLAADGTDANIDINITPKGTGTATVTGSIKMIDGNQTAGYVMTCDANGVGTWQVAADPDFSDGGEAGGADRTIGNTDNYDLGFVTNNVNRLQIQNDGNIGVNVADPCSLVEIWDDDAHPVFSITAAHDTDYDPQIQFRTDATDTVKASLGVDASDDSLRINMGSGVGGASHFIMDANGGFKFQNSTDSTTAYQWLDADGGTPILNIDSTNERVGINTVTPAYTLDIHDGNFRMHGDDGNNVGFLFDQDSGTTNRWYFAADTNGYFVIQDADNSWTTPFRMQTGTPTYTLAAYATGYIAIGAVVPSTLLELYGTAPYFTSHNSTEENIEGGRECIWRAKGEKQDGTEHTLGQMQFSHDGTGDDYKADFILSVNQNGGVDTLVEALRIDSSGNVGIGTTGPGDKLEVQDAVSATPITNGIVRIVGTGTNPATGSGGGLTFWQEASNAVNYQYASITGRRVNNAVNNEIDLDFNSGSIVDGIPLATRMTIKASGNIGIGETSPETLVEMTSTVPYFTSHNSTEENIEGGRECIWRAKGEKQDGTEHTLGQMQFSHDGTGDDYKADFILSLNVDAGADTLTERLRIASDGLMSVEGNIYPMNDDTYYIGKNDDDTPFAWKGVILKDTTDGKYYRIEIINGVVTATDLTGGGGVDTANKRRAASGFFLFLLPPVPDNDIDTADDRYHNAGFYRSFT